MPKWRIKLVGQAYVYRFEEIEASDLDTAIEQAEKTFHDDPIGWQVDEMKTNGPDAVHVATNSWKRID